MKKISPDRLHKLRSNSGLTQPELAKRMGIDTSTISRWEKGIREPSLEQCISLSRSLGITLDYLLNAELNVNFQFRSKKTSSPVEKSAITSALVDAEMQIYYLDSAYKMAEKLPSPFNLKYDFYQQQLPTIAEQLRNILKLNQRITFEEFKQALSEVNIHVFEWALPLDVSGFSYRDSYSVVFINRLHSKERKLFTLAHEFAHLLFHLGRENKQTVVSLISSSRDPVEKEAYAFASELLMPSDMLDKIIEEGGKNLKRIEVLDHISHYFNVSREALFYRLVEKGIFSWEEKKLYFSKYKIDDEVPRTRIENIDEEISPEFLRTALELYDMENISAGKLADWFFVDQVSLEEYLSARTNVIEEILVF